MCVGVCLFVCVCVCVGVGEYTNVCVCVSLTRIDPMESECFKYGSYNRLRHRPHSSFSLSDESAYESCTSIDNFTR